MNKPFKGKIPVTACISSYGDDKRRKILFKCPKCYQLFRYYEEKEKFCHNCGQKINWEDVRANYVLDRDLIEECFNNCDKYREVIEAVNRFNNNKKLTKLAILKDNENGK